MAENSNPPNYVVLGSYREAKVGEMCLGPDKYKDGEYFQWFYRPDDGLGRFKDVPTVKVAGEIRTFVKKPHPEIANLFLRVS